MCAYVSSCVRVEWGGKKKKKKEGGGGGGSVSFGVSLTDYAASLLLNPGTSRLNNGYGEGRRMTAGGGLYQTQRD